jgi:hypothetical protein
LDKEYLGELVQNGTLAEQADGSLKVLKRVPLTADDMVGEALRMFDGVIVMPKAPQIKSSMLDPELAKYRREVEYQTFTGEPKPHAFQTVESEEAMGRHLRAAPDEEPPIIRQPAEPSDTPRTMPGLSLSIASWTVDPFAVKYFPKHLSEAEYSSFFVAFFVLIVLREQNHAPFENCHTLAVR